MLTILNVASPRAAVSRDSCGSAEQILAQIDSGLVDAGHRSIVVAGEGSSIAGRLVTVPLTADAIDAGAPWRCGRTHRDAIERAIAEHGPDLIHVHGWLGPDLDTHLPPPGVPVLATLYGPATRYSAEMLNSARAGVFFNTVSMRQIRGLRTYPHVVASIENGVPVDAFSDDYKKRRFALVLARIAPDSGIEVAIDAAKAAGMAMIIAGELQAVRDHQSYFSQQVAPRLDASRRWIGPVSFAVKRRLLGEARCLVVCPAVDEPGSLAAREALAAGTPVVGLVRGALLDTVEPGRTGFLVADTAELATAILRADEIDPVACRSSARARFDARVMVRSYIALYERLIADARADSAPPHALAAPSI